MMREEPIYRTIKDTLKAGILAGNYTYGERVPSESELCREYQVSRISAKHALVDLEREGYIRRIAGKGSFVSYAPIEHLVDGFYCLNDEIRNRGFVPTSQLVCFEEMEVAQVDPFERVGLNRFMLLADKDRVYHIQCRRYSNDEVIAADNTYIPVKYCPSITAEEIVGDDSIYRIVEEKYNYGPVRARESYLARLINEKDAQLLDIEAGSPTMKVLRVCYAQGRPMIFNMRVYKGEKIHLSVDLGMRTSR